MPLRLSRWLLESCSVLESRRILSCGVSNSCRLGGRKSSSAPNIKPSSQSSATEALERGRLADIIPGLATLFECIVRCPKPSSPDPRGDEPRSGSLIRASLPKAELCKFRTASVGMVVFAGNELGGDSRPNLEGTDAATAPCLAMYEIPWLSKEAGMGASKTLRWPIGEMGFRSSSRGDPYFESGCDT